MIGGQHSDALQDSVDGILDAWARERPDLDFSPIGVVTRLGRVRGYLDEGLNALFKRYDLSAADFQVVVALRRTGKPYRLAQARLMSQLALTSGTVSVRIDRLVKRGVVVRDADPSDARVALVRLTPAGLALFDEIAPEHLANEDRLLSSLDDTDRKHLADLLRRLLVSFEHRTVEAGLRLGLRLESAHVARSRRIAVGLSDVPGLLVTQSPPGTPAAEAGVIRGDLLVDLDGTALRDAAALQTALSRVVGGRARLRLLRGNHELEVEVTFPTP